MENPLVKLHGTPQNLWNPPSGFEPRRALDPCSSSAWDWRRTSTGPPNFRAMQRFFCGQRSFFRQKDMMDLTRMMGNGDSSIKHAGKWKSSAWNLVEKCDLAIKNDDFCRSNTVSWWNMNGNIHGDISWDAIIIIANYNPGLPKTRPQASPNCHVFFMDDGLNPSWSPTHDNHQNLELEKDQTLQFTIFFTRESRNISNQFKEKNVTIIRIHQQ